MEAWYAKGDISVHFCDQTLQILHQMVTAIIKIVANLMIYSLLALKK